MGSRNRSRYWLNVAGWALVAGILLAVSAAAIVRFTMVTMHPGTPNVAHAGGRIEGRTYTNSIPAFDNAYRRGFRFIEADLQRTADDVVVCGHDWTGFPEEAPVYEAFLRHRQTMAFQPCTFDELVNWFAMHPDAYLVSDPKTDAVEINHRLYAELGQALVAQAYSALEVRLLTEAGIESVILTLYRVDGFRILELEELERSGRSVAGVTMPVASALGGLALWAKFRLNAPVYAHTVNPCWLLSPLHFLAVDAIYTDDLGPEGCVSPGQS